MAMNRATRTSRIPMLNLLAEQQVIGGELAAAIQDVVGSGQFIHGPNVFAFEKEVAEYLGVEHAVSVNSGTDALVLGLDAMGIGPGDEVITSPFTFVAAAEAICRVGATPIFADISAGTFHLDPGCVEAVISRRTRAIIPVHLFGEFTNIAAILDIAHRHSLLVLEDVAQAFGAESGGRKAGSLGSAGAFSFFPSKPLGAYGDGGLFVTNDDRLAEQVRCLARHGATTRYFSELVGYNTRLDEIQAAILRVKLKRVDEFNASRRDVAARYSATLKDVQGII